MACRLSKIMELPYVQIALRFSEDSWQISGFDPPFDHISKFGRTINS